MISTNESEVMMTRTGVAEALTTAGYPVAPSTLSTKATRGGGPPYIVFSGRAMYSWGDALNWARTSTAKPRSSAAQDRF